MNHKPIEDALKQFYQDCAVGHSIQEKAPITIKNIQSTWNLFLKVTPLEYCEQVTEAALRRFFRWGAEDPKRKWMPMTIRSHRKNLSVFIRWAVDRKYMPNNPLRRIPKNKLPQRVPKHHTEKEIEAMFDGIGLTSTNYFEETRNKAIIGMAALAGLRRGELINLKLSDINMETKQILVKAETSKSRKERWVPIVHRLDNLLTEYLKVREQHRKDGCQKLWLSAVTGKELTESGLEFITKKISDIVGFKVRLHSLRHSYGTYTYAGCHDIKAVQENMGHSDLSTTILYVNALSQDKRHAAEMSPLNRV